VALQEVDCRTRRSGRVDQLGWLAREAGYAHHAFFKACDWDEGGYGIGLLSRYPLSSVRSDLLPVPEGVEPRIVGSARLEHPLGELSVHVTHLSHRLRRARLRRKQALRLLELAAGEGPRLLLGDLNDFDWSGTYRKLPRRFVDVFLACGNGPPGTHPLGPLLPAVRIDYLFASPDIALEGAKGVQTNASDHHLLMADVRAPLTAARRAVG